MRPIQDIADLRQGHVLYHSAFGFARVDDIGEADVRVSWESPDRNLPQVVSRDTLRRVYSLCRPGGFFERALLAPEPLQELLQVDPLTALEMLLEDLAGPQSAGDLKEWLVALGLFNEGAFDRCWSGLEPRVLRDGRFRETKGLLSLKVNRGDGSPVRQLDDPMLSPSRRLDLALELRDRLGEDPFRQHVCAAWRAGGTQVREMALKALAGHHPNLVMSELLGPGPDNAEALIHALRRAGWSPDQFDERLLDALMQRVREGIEDPGLLEQEGRLTAAVARWWPDGGQTLLVELAGDPVSQRLVAAALEALPPNRAEELHLALLASALDERRRPAAGWLTWLLLDGTEESPAEVAERVEGRYALVARWIRERFLDSGTELRHDDDLEDAPLDTMEVELEPLGDEEMMALGDLPARTGRTMVSLAIAIARALADAHDNGQVCNPTGRSYVLHLDGTVELRVNETDPNSSPRPSGEPPSMPADIYASAVLLLEAMLGRIWPRNIPADRVLPYLRHVVPDLPPAAVAPLDVALHPAPEGRPETGREWLALWEAVGRAEAARIVMDATVPRPLAVGYDTHVGHMKMLHTQTNQDSMAVASRGALHLLCVCDGISTANAGSGDVASGISTHVLGSLWEQNLSRLQGADDFSAEAFVERALAMANRAVCEAALRFAGGDLAGRVPMGTTAVVALIRGSRVQLGWLGDSRAYLVGRYGASLLTADQNQAGERLKSWHRGEELIWDPAGFALVGYVGHFNEDYRPEALVPRQASFTMLPGERLVICSDGVTDYIANHQPAVSRVILQHVRDSEPYDAAPALVAAANRGGGGDNCTCIVASLLARGDDETEDLSGELLEPSDPV